MKTLVTGAAGFVGSHFVNSIPSEDIVALVRVNKVGNFNRIKDVGNVKCVWHDLRSPINEQTIEEIGEVDNIIHFGAETHVDRSITNPLDFVESNLIGTFNLLEYARKIGLKGRFIQFSTDEVFGPAKPGQFYMEKDNQIAKNPYAATKAGAEQLVFAWANTYGLNISIVRSMNIFGEYQNAEKFVPLCINKILNGETIYIHSDKTKTIPGSRYYIHADDVATGVKMVLENGVNDTAYHCVGEKEISNLYLAQCIAGFLDRKLKYELVDFHSSRPGHDLRYALGNVNLKERGWDVTDIFENNLNKTVRWYLDNPVWLGAKK